MVKPDLFPFALLGMKMLIVILNMYNHIDRSGN